MLRLCRILAVLAVACLLPLDATAFDAHQVQVQPGQGDLARPLIVYQPWTAPRGTLATTATFEYAANPLELTLINTVDGSVITVPLVAELSVLNLGIAVGVTDRLALSAGIPLYLAQSRVTGLGNSQPSTERLGLTLGDLRITAPIHLTSSQGGFVLGIIPELELPTGNSNRNLGKTGPRVGVVASAGWSNEHWNTTANLGARVAGGKADDGTLDDATRVSGVLGLAVGATPTDRVGLGAEFWSHPSPSSSGLHTTGAAEAVYHVDVRGPKGTDVVLGVAHALTDGAGSSSWRAFAGLRFSRRPSEDPVEVIPIVEEQHTPYDLLVTARDDEGRRIDADLIVIGEDQEYRTEFGRSGEAIVQLAPGAWEVTVVAEGFGSQTRTMVLDEDRFLPPTIDAVLHAEQGQGSLAVVVEDAESQGIADAELHIDGNRYGNTSTEGTLTIGGLAEGEHELTARAEDFEELEPISVIASTEGADLTSVLLERPPGSVKVIVRTNKSEVVPALVRFSGPSELGPEPIGPTGEKLFVLEDGEWTVVISSDEYGLQQREVHVDGLRKVLQVVDVVLAAELGSAELQLAVIDPDGNPVQGAKVSIDGEHHGSTSNAGTLVLAGLQPGTITLSLHGERFLEQPPIEVELVDGVRELLVTMDWKPGTLQVVTRGRGEVPVDALVRFEGPGSISPTPVGADGEAFFELLPGTWTVGVSAETLGLQERVVTIEANQTSLIVISAVLRKERGDSVLDIHVSDPNGEPIDGARVAVDGEPVGTTSTGGSLRLEGLAPGDSVLEVAGEFHEYTVIDPLALAEGENVVELVLEWLAGTVIVTILGPDGPIDAVVRAYGPVVMAPVRTGIDGDRVLYLEPGGWAVVASSPDLGIEQVEVQVEAGQEALLRIEFTLRELEEDQSRLILAIVDADEEPVAGATVRFEGREYTTAEGGSVVFEEAAMGEQALSVQARGYEPLADTVTIVRGNQTRTLRLEWVPVPITVVVRTNEGEPLKASVKWIGPSAVPDGSTGDDGSLSTELRPGAWTLVADTPDLGAGRAEVRIEPGLPPEPVVIELVDSRVELVEGEVKILEQVYFDTGLASIRPESYDVLDEVANVLLMHPEIRRVEVQGHTDDIGTEDTNARLSQRRADAVRAYLISKDVPRSRLVARGYGNTQPFASNDTEEGRSQNRRVQFEILEENSEP